jgi:oligopeptide/dipeptide ABC transporter ATP-binding protein
MEPKVILKVEDLKTCFYSQRGVAKVVNGVSFELRKGEILGIVGESGCGKSITAASILGVLPGSSGKIVGGKIIFENENLLEKSPEEMRGIRGNKISIICQNPGTLLNPLLTIGRQLGEVAEFHSLGEDRKKRSRIRERVIEILQDVQIPSPEMQIDNYPFRLSGGLAQRVAIGMSLMCRPEIIIADEPTTALDVTIQAQIVQLLRRLREEFGTSIIFITHDFGVIARTCDTVGVMYAGRIIEYADVRDLFGNPRHPYTVGLMKSIPILGSGQDKLHSLRGQPPDPMDLPEGCVFEPRCEKRIAKCRVQYPPEVHIGKDHYVSCWVH